MTMPKVGDRISGGRLSHYYAEVEAVFFGYILIRYNGECRSVRINRCDLWRVM
jgi:hypothetical protein